MHIITQIDTATSKPVMHVYLLTWFLHNCICNLYWESLGLACSLLLLLLFCSLLSLSVLRELTFSIEVASTFLMQCVQCITFRGFKSLHFSPFRVLFASCYSFFFFCASNNEIQSRYFRVVNRQNRWIIAWLFFPGAISSNGLNRFELIGIAILEMWIGNMRFQISQMIIHYHLYVECHLVMWERFIGHTEWTQVTILNDRIKTFNETSEEEKSHLNRWQKNWNVLLELRGVWRVFGVHEIWWNIMVDLLTLKICFMLDYGCRVSSCDHILLQIVVKSKNAARNSLKWNVLL